MFELRSVRTIQNTGKYYVEINNSSEACGEVKEFLNNNDWYFTNGKVLIPVELFNRGK